MNIDDLNRLRQLALRGHYYCDDTWYSCPKAPDGCANEYIVDECTCGADKHNAEVERLYEKILRGLT